MGGHTVPRLVHTTWVPIVGAPPFAADPVLAERDREGGRESGTAAVAMGLRRTRSHREEVVEDHSFHDERE